MDLYQSLEPWWRFAAAILIGALIGLEREFIQQRTGEPDFAGIRTFSLLALAGAIAAYLTDRFGILLFLALYLGLALLIWASYLGDIYRNKDQEGITTEVVALVVPLLGAMVIWDEFVVAAALGVITALILAIKAPLHQLARRMSSEDLRATLEFAIITVVILPILPNETVGPFNVVNPFQVWLLVVLVSGISFLGYILIKVRGSEQGVGITGLLGGLVSSTATTVSFAGRSVETPQLSRILLLGILLASAVMFPRILVEVAVVYPPLLGLVALPLTVMFLVCIALVVYLHLRQRDRKDEGREEVKLSNPLRLSTAITFAIAFAVVLVLVRGANEYFGNAGVYLTSAIAGIVDVDAITLTASELASTAQIDASVAATAIILAALVNTAAKAVFAISLGSKELRKPVLITFGIVLLAGTLSGVLYFAVVI